MRLIPTLVTVISLVASAAAQDSAAQLYDKAMNALTGSTTSRNPLGAIEFLRSSAAKGYVPAQVALGYLYESGTYVAGMPSEAALWCRKAAEQGDKLGQWALGRQYFMATGVSRDLPTAERWLKPAAESGDPFAQYFLGLTLLERDESAAVGWLRKAAEQGLPQAQYRLALAYDAGHGISRDRAEAYVWMLLSSEAGRSDTQPKLSELEGALGSTKVEELKMRVRELQRTVVRSVNAHGCTGWDGELRELPTVPPLDIQKYCR